MQLKLDVILSETEVHIQLPEDLGTINIKNYQNEIIKSKTPAVFIALKDNNIIKIGTLNTGDNKQDNADKMILITPPWDIELAYIEQFFIEEALKMGNTLEGEVQADSQIPTNVQKTVTEYTDKIMMVLQQFGYTFQVKEVEVPVKAKPAKVQHRWSKTVSQIEFNVSFRGSDATIVWQKRTEMLIKKGATLLAEAPLNKDGSVGISVKVGEKLREDNALAIANFKTTEDIILKSVNEVGLFLYFAGTNSWLEFKDKDGRTIDEWTSVKIM